MVTLAIWGEVTAGAILIKCGLWGDMVDVITCAIFHDCRLRGVGVVRGVICLLPLTWRVALITLVTLPCDRVIGVADYAVKQSCMRLTLRFSPFRGGKNPFARTLEAERRTGLAKLQSGNLATWLNSSRRRWHTIAAMTQSPEAWTPVASRPLIFKNMEDCESVERIDAHCVRRTGVLLISTQRTLHARAPCIDLSPALLLY